MSTLDKILYVRCDQALFDLLDKETERRQREASPGENLNRTDVARRLLVEAVYASNERRSARKSRKAAR